MMDIHVDHCSCVDRSFAELLELARDQGMTLRELAQATGASRECGLCRTYLIEAFRTGETSFHRLLAEDPMARDDIAPPPR